MNLESLSKTVSYALRHNPEQFGLELDKQGWIYVDTLIVALRKIEQFKSLSNDDIEKMIQASEKKRHEIQDGKIRALYGHSIKEKIVRNAVKPPDILYHGTSRKFAERIMSTGLISKDRQYVHLSEDADKALTIGKRRDENPVIIEINAKKAWGEGVSFYYGNEDVWLSDDISVKYLTRWQHSATFGRK